MQQTSVLPSKCGIRGRRWFAQALVLAVVLSAGLPGCKIRPREKPIDPKVTTRDNLAANTEQIRLKARAVLGPLASSIVTSADQIMAGTDDYEVRRAALLWKIDAVPALREALFQPNPLTAAMDAWVMSFQMIDYFEHGPGRKALGDAAAIAVTACRRLEAEMHEFAISVSRSGDADPTREFARKWAAAHPIKFSIASRESTLRRATEREVADAFSAGAAIADAVVTLDDLNRRIEVYSAQIPDQARWQAELLAMDLAHRHELAKAMPLAERALETAEAATKAAIRAATAAEKAIATTDRLAPGVERALATVADLPRTVAEERAAAMSVLEESLERERAAALQALTTDLEFTINFVHEERVAALDHLSRERAAALADLRELVGAERAKATDDAERISLAVVDHAFWRAAQLVGAVVLVLLVAGGVGLLILVRSGRGRTIS